MKYHKNFQGNQKKKKNLRQIILKKFTWQTYQFLFKADTTHVGTEFGSITGVIFS